MINPAGLSRLSGVKMSAIKRFIKDEPVRGETENMIRYSVDQLRKLLCPEDERPVELSLIEDVKQLLSGTNLDACNFLIYVLNNPDYKNMWEAFAGYTVEVIRAAANTEKQSN